jgi:hypothetical protein
MRRLLTLSTLLCLLAMPVQAVIPQLISHQGLLTDSGGHPLGGQPHHHRRPLREQ